MISNLEKFGKLYRKYLYLTLFSFFFLTFISIYNYFILEIQKPLNLIIGMIIGLFPLCFYMFEYYRFLILNEKNIIIKKFIRNNHVIRWNEIREIIISQQIYSQAEEYGKKIMMGGGSVLFAANDIEKRSMWQISINNGIKNVKIRIPLLITSRVNQLHKIVFERSQLKYLSRLEVPQEEWKNKKRKEIFWIWKREGNSQELNYAKSFTEDLHKTFQFSLD